MEFRWLGDNSVTEGYAMLFDHLMQDAGWLQRYTGLETQHDAGVPAQRRRSRSCTSCGATARSCIYEVQLYGGDVSWDALPDLYVELLTGATSFQYARADAFVDVDPRFYAARYLRAWQLQALITETLRERYDADWWRNPRAGPWIAESLMAHGQELPAGAIAAQLGAAGLSFAPVVRTIERALA